MKNAHLNRFNVNLPLIFHKIIVNKIDKIDGCVI